MNQTNIRQVIRRDDVFLGGQGSGLAGGELGGLDGPLEPLEQVAVEAAVQFLGVQGGELSGQQAVKVGVLAVGVHPAQACGPGQLLEDADVFLLAALVRAAQRLRRVAAALRGAGACPRLMQGGCCICAAAPLVVPNGRTRTAAALMLVAPESLSSQCGH